MSEKSEINRSGTFRALVQSGSTATAYVCSGAGRPVLVLRQAEAHPVWSQLISAIAPRFRVITPEVPANQPEFDRWLRHFLDGLGHAEVRILADQTLAAPAIGFAILDPDRVERLAVISPTGPAIPGSIVEGGHPILFLRDDRPAAEIVATVTRFLAEGDPAVDKAG